MIIYYHYNNNMCDNLLSEISDIEDSIKHKKNNISENIWQELVNEFNISYNLFETKKDVIIFQKKIQRKYKVTLSNCDLIKIYNTLQLDNNKLKNIITKKKQKSNSGVLVITVLTSAHPEYIDDDGNTKIAKFSCKHDCAYCPNEKAHEGNNWVAQPRSYLFSEPAVLRANDNDFDSIKQFNARISTLIQMGHTADKLEIIVLGGTWTEYPRQYQDRFITELYYAANTYYDIYKREMLSLEEEININDIESKINIIGLTLETRPDTITLEEIKHFRRYNCTRIQLGVQHTHNDVLKKINRGHDIECVYDAIKLLKNNCYKVDIHLMPNLPGSSYEKDEDMLNSSLYDERLQVDQYKIYPTAIVPWTKIKKWYDSGEYIPYDDIKLYELIKEFKKKVQKWKRLNRIIRDIPSSYITGGYDKKYVNMRQLLQNDMKKNNWECKCIRCKEVGNNIVNFEDIKLNIETYSGSNGIEYFISYETDKYLIGFIRLRLNKDYDNVLPILENSALIRELHVYSNLNNVGNNINESMQHKGFGKKLIEEAEKIALNNGYNKIAIISGTGVRNYYRKFGYELCDTYMVKTLIKNTKCIIQ
jgi:ELP3 family radical SAM enzyme/protein acetyltransferase